MAHSNYQIKNNMVELRFPITKIENEMFQVVVDMALYAKEALVAACYKFTDRCYIHQQIPEDDSNIILVTIEAKENNVIDETFAKQFCNELIDQQVKVTTEEKFGHIRDLIVEEAFKPVNK